PPSFNSTQLSTPSPARPWPHHSTDQSITSKSMAESASPLSKPSPLDPQNPAPSSNPTIPSPSHNNTASPSLPLLPQDQQHSV
ncbi:hypothetical protein VIGAN_11082100, partial [Vigna angularis var. angularis]